MFFANILDIFIARINDKIPEMKHITKIKISCCNEISFNSV